MFFFNKKSLLFLFFAFFLLGDFAAPEPAHAIEVIDWIYNFFSSFFGSLVDVFIWLLESIFWILSEFPYMVFNGFLLVVEGAFTLLDLSGFILDSTLDWSSLPDQLVWILGEIDFSQGISIIMTGIGIRMLINLIPGVFTRI